MLSLSVNLKLQRTGPIIAEQQPQRWSVFFGR